MTESAGELRLGAQLEQGWPAKAKHHTVGRLLEIKEMCNQLFGLACTLLWYFNSNKMTFIRSTFLTLCTPFPDEKLCEIIKNSVC